MSYPDAPGHRNVETWIAAAHALAPKLGRLQRMAESTIRDAGANGLTADELAALDNVSALPPEYPGWMLARQASGREPAA